MRLSSIKLRKVLNSRGEETIEFEINKRGIGSAPSGASKGKRETAYYVKNINNSIRIFLRLKNKLNNIRINEFEDLKKIESIVSEKVVGGNVLIALEYSILNALSKEHNQPLFKLIGKGRKLPRLLGNCIGGGKHSLGGLRIQECLLIPKTRNIKQGAFINSAIHKKVGNYLKNKGLFAGKTDEGAWNPNIDVNRAISILKKEIGTTNKKIDIGLDIAASSLYKKGHYFYKDKKLNKHQQIEFIIELIKKKKLYYVEDPLEENDFKGFSTLLDNVKNCLICGDDLTVTNPIYIEKAIQNSSINSVIIKPNQVGSLIKTKQAVELSLKNKIIPVISHRSGETLDITIAHLAVSWNIPFIKTGIVGGERVAKINELIRIEEKIKDFKNQKV